MPGGRIERIVFETLKRSAVDSLHKIDSWVTLLRLKVTIGHIGRDIRIGNVSIVRADRCIACQDKGIRGNDLLTDEYCLIIWIGRGIRGVRPRSKLIHVNSRSTRVAIVIDNGEPGDGP